MHAQGVNQELDAIIGEKEAELLPLREQMETLKTKFAKATVEFASDWYKTTAKQYITKYPHITLKMGADKIARMKAKINALVDDCPKLVERIFDNPTLWWHKKPRLHESIELYKQVGDRNPEVVDQAVRQVLGLLGVVLEEFRFDVTVCGNRGAYQEFWFASGIGTQQIVPCYPHLLKWTEKMEKTLRQYDMVYVDALALYNEIQLLKEERSRQQALSLWESL